MTNDYHKPIKTDKNLIPQQNQKNKSALLTYSEYKNKKNGSWEDYKKYLKENGGISPSLYATI